MLSNNKKEGRVGPSIIMLFTAVFNGVVFELIVLFEVSVLNCQYKSEE